MSRIAANGKSLESWIWDAACSIRGARDAPKHKDYISPLIFTPRRLGCPGSDSVCTIHRMGVQGPYLCHPGTPFLSSLSQQPPRLQRRQSSVELLVPAAMRRK